MKTTAFVVAVVLLLVACTQPTPADTQETQTSAPGAVPALDGTPEPVKTGEDGAPEREFTVTLDEFTFLPETMSVSQGDAVVMTIENVGEEAHGFGLLEFGINERIEPGETKTIRFVADKKGTFRIFCSVPCGSGHGRMQATLVVA